MTTRDAAATALISFLFAASAAAPGYADDGTGVTSSRTFEACRSNAAAGCTRFEGYIYVRRSVTRLAPAADNERGGTDAVFVGKRLYVHVDGVDNR